jgi:hypothetical protein
MRKPSERRTTDHQLLGSNQVMTEKATCFRACLRSCQRLLPDRKLKRFLRADKRTIQSKPRSSSSSLIAAVSLASQPPKPCRLGFQRRCRKRKRRMPR